MLDQDRNFSKLVEDYSNSISEKTALLEHLAELYCEALSFFVFAGEHLLKLFGLKN